MKDAVKKTYGKKGDKIVNMNNQAIDIAIDKLVRIDYPQEWAATTSGAVPVSIHEDDYYKTIIHPVNTLKGDLIPVSSFDPAGIVPTGTTKFEKRGIAVNIPDWIPENCIMCNQCSLVCPHGCIRPILTNEEQTASAPDDYVTKDARGFDGYKYRIQLSPLDCTGCGNCANVCPSKQKALNMVPITQICDKEEQNWNFAVEIPEPPLEFKTNTVIGSQYKKPLFEFSGACTGCGETPYVKLITQLFGDRMLIANATGCSSIYGGSSPTCPYTVNDKGQGPAWANSLFEDNAEFGYGMNLALVARRSLLKQTVKEALDQDIPEEVKEVLSCWLNNVNDGEKSKGCAAKLNEVLPKYAGNETIAKILKDADLFVKKSVWIFGGDGWAYDIGYGGLDHVIAMGEDVNILVLDTEVYSNTGGQSSKATPTGSTAKFATAGKRTKKKDLGAICMTYGYVYVTSIAMGANQNQTLKALIEAERYPGPSVVIAYSPCINHGINMSKAQEVQKSAVEAGYWNLYRYNPALKDEGKNPFILDSKDPICDYKDFIKSETRYRTLIQLFPDIAEQLFDQATEEAKARLEYYKLLAK